MNGTIRKNGVDSVPGLYVAVIGPETGVFARSGFGHTRTCIAEMYICLTNERGRPRFLVDINQFERKAQPDPCESILLCIEWKRFDV